MLQDANAQEYVFKYGNMIQFIFYSGNHILKVKVEGLLGREKKEKGAGRGKTTWKKDLVFDLLINERNLKIARPGS